MCRKFNHGAAGLYWFNGIHFQSNLGDFSVLMPLPHPYESWFPWVEAVTGHHGLYYIPQDQDKSRWEMPASRHLVLRRTVTH